ncbi:hypothetical protein [Aurantimonas sp. HBX-1]|uniref:hypothetical protein n=1 Tax=Aurantimonas sp. HBX-1 TaxID=2906072 RepID=UPI001F1D3C90|nr:hypothetical protein [Aurantimonas sp. HBX-1]UIJ73470.1 hypothetical protein LXB15_07510 [Aurantimonas sp. HBX-1]
MTDAAAFKAMTFRSPRPVHYLEELRSLGGTPPTKTVQILLEALIAAAIDADRSMPPVSHRMSVRALLAVLGKSSRKGDLEVALVSLRDALFSIPDVHEREEFRPKARQTYDEHGEPVTRKRRTWTRRSPPEVVSFHPFDRLELEGSDLCFELSSVLRRALSGQHQYGYLDLVAISNFRSAYTLPLYRLIVSRTRQTRTKSPSGTTDLVALRIDELASITGYKRQGGGYVAQIKRTIIDAAVRDFSRPCARGKGDDGVRANLPITYRSKGEFVTFIVQIAMPSVEQLSYLRRQTYDSGTVRRVSPRDDPRLQIPVGVLLKVEKQYEIVDTAATNAWLMAVHEMESGVDLTDAAKVRRWRREGLRKALASRSIEHVLYDFLVEEAMQPDLITLQHSDVSTRRDAWDAAEFRFRVHRVGLEKAQAEQEAKDYRRRVSFEAQRRYRIEMRDALPVLPLKMKISDIQHEVLLRCVGCTTEQRWIKFEAELFPNRTVRDSLDYWREQSGCSGPDCGAYAVRIDRDGRFIDDQGRSAVPGR